MKDIKQLPEIGFLRLKQVLEIFPVGKSTWWAGVSSGKYPQPVKLSLRCTAWRMEDILALVARTGAGGCHD